MPANSPLSTHPLGTPTTEETIAYLTSEDIQKLLDLLCVKYGFCLPPAHIEHLKEYAPDEVRAFTDAVFRAEGLDPETARLHLYRQIRTEIADAFRRAEYHGA